jgi:hypothetical protein
MLLPALNKARERAKSISCIGNVKQLGSAFAMYNDDFEDFFPGYTGINALSSSKTWANGLSELYFNKKWDVFRCPSHMVKTSIQLNQYVHYGYNLLNIGSNYRISGNGSTPVKVLNLQHPSTTLIVADSFYPTSTKLINGIYCGYYIITDVPSTSSYQPHPRHFNMFNVLWGDFHVSSVTSSLNSLSKTYTDSVLGKNGSSNNKWNIKRIP